MQRQKRSPLFLMALTIFIDFTGFGLILPLLPFWAERLGAGPLGIGLVLTVYAAAQFVFTPVLGRLSDRYGRKPIIAASLLIETLSLILTALAGSLPILLIARLIGGLGASNMGSAQAVVVDVTQPGERARGMGIIGAAIGLGFVCGPALGGILSPLGTTLPFWVAAAVAFVNMLLVILLLPETHGRQTSGDSNQNGREGLSILVSGWSRAARYQAVLPLVLVNLCYMLAFAAMESIFPLFTQHYFGWGASQNGYTFTLVGVMVVLMQGGLVGQLVKRWREQTVLIGGLVLLALGLVLLALSRQLPWLLASLGILSIGDGAVTPTLSTLLSFACPATTQGEILGLSQGVGGLGRTIAPLTATGIYAFAGPTTPLVAGGILVMLAGLLAFPAVSAIHKPVPAEAVTQETNREMPAHARDHQRNLWTSKK